MFFHSHHGDIVNNSFVTSIIFFGVYKWILMDTLFDDIHGFMSWYCWLDTWRDTTTWYGLVPMIFSIGVLMLFHFFQWVYSTMGNHINTYTRYAPVPLLQTGYMYARMALLYGIIVLGVSALGEEFYYTRLLPHFDLGPDAFWFLMWGLCHHLLSPSSHVAVGSKYP